MCDLCDDTLTKNGRARRSLVFAAVGAGALFQAPVVGLAATGSQIRPRTLNFYHTHTGERLRVVFAEGNRIIPDALTEVSRFLRDFRSGESRPIDPQLLDILHRLQQQTGGKGPYEIISAYRSPQTNDMLRSSTSGVAQGSLHMEGRAIDVRLRGVDTSQLRQAALGLQAGGVGYYQSSDFIHVDTGRVRFW